MPNDNFLLAAPLLNTLLNTRCIRTTSVRMLEIATYPEPSHRMAKTWSWKAGRSKQCWLPATAASIRVSKLLQSRPGKRV
ncbi:hypothetical protein Y032_0402g813 [Ancylostoma ceylanicum]|uniref:Uncharacterized protein n=1 Tax=Ancylostoma ceylanicum TaxID=53326 RepID=A0A016X418_9BILA|nr:hypothetical protein Y032_0402g813 [Ancylostoma ceylanicum]